MKKQIAIIGGGPSALMLAAYLDETKFDVTIYEKNKSVGRKFLVAGKGGFNLTHSEGISKMANRYTPNDFLTEALKGFSNSELREWLGSIGVPTFVGSSRRIYPVEHIKPIEVLNAILEALKQKKVKINYGYNWIGWDSLGRPKFENNETVDSDYTVFALGGGSWKVTGSNGDWLTTFQQKGIDVIPFQPSNCAYQVKWNPKVTKFAGEPLKNIAITCGELTQKGEVVLTDFGLEGNAIYALSPQLRQELKKNKIATIYIDLKPSLSTEVVIQKIKQSKQSKITDILKKELKLSPVQLALVKIYVSKDHFLDGNQLAIKIKNLKIEVSGLSKLDEAISTVGGVNLNAIDSNYQVKNLPNQFCIGEMLDWDAPTGGYLLQACFTMGVSLAKYFNASH